MEKYKYGHKPIKIFETIRKLCQFDFGGLKTEYAYKKCYHPFNPPSLDNWN